MNTKETSNEIRLRGWIYLGIELELELVEIIYEYNKATEVDDQVFWGNKQTLCKRKLETVHSRVAFLEARIDNVA
jgi:hypothetical protein